MKLVIKVSSGVADRVRGILWAIEMASASGRELEIIWERTPECGAAFTELFQPIGIPVHDIDPYQSLRLLDLCFAPDSMCLELFRIYDGDLKVNFVAENLACGQFGDLFKPAPYVAACVWSFGARLSRDCVGVHVRRGDKEGHLSFPNTAEYFEVIPKNNQVFVATDSIGILGEFNCYYGSRLAWYPVRSWARDSREATIDSIVVLYLLRSLKYFVSSEYSGFSALVSGSSRVDDPKRRLNFYILRPGR